METTNQFIWSFTLTNKKVHSNNMYIGEIITSVGVLTVFRYRVKNMRSMAGFIGEKSLSDISPEDFIRKLVSVTSYRAEDVVDEKEPDKSLSDEEVRQLTLKDLDDFSRLFISNHEYLEKERLPNKRDQDDKIVVSYEYGESYTSQFEDEPSYKYLHRLFSLEQERTRDQIERNFERIGMPSSLRKHFEHTTKIGSVLNEQLKALQPITASVAALNHPINDTHAGILKSAALWKEMTSPLEDITVVDSPKLPSVGKKLKWPPEDRLEPTEKIIEKIKAKQEADLEREQRALELSEQAVEHSNEQLKVMNVMAEQMVNLNQNQLQAAAENKESSQESGHIARQGLNINWAVLVMTFFGLLVGSFSLYVTYTTTQIDTEMKVENEQLKAELTEKNNQLKEMEQQNKKVAELEAQISKLQSAAPVSASQEP